MENYKILTADLERFASNAAFVLEIGTNIYSMQAFIQGLEKSQKSDKLYVSVDINSMKPKEKPDLPYWHIIHGDSKDYNTLEEFKKLAELRAPDILFINTKHTYEHMQRELKIWNWIACEPTTWLFHGTWLMGKYNHMTDAIKEFCNQYPYWIYDDYRILNNGLGRVKWI